MQEWKNRAEITSDVVRFAYAKSGVESNAEEVYVWDLDKTYLDTQYETLRGLLRTFIEKAVQKRNVPGTAILVKSLQDAWVGRFGKKAFPIFFITASPPQMEAKILEKLIFDGIHPLGLFCKDNFRNLHPKRMWRLTNQVGYKLQALLQMRLNLYEDVRQIMWGDDSESDVIIYSLYSDICCRRRSEVEIEKVLKFLGVTGVQLQAIFDLQAQIPKQDPVEKIYINLAEDTDAEYYIKFGRRTLPTFNSFQTALDLFQDHRLQGDHVVRVAESLIKEFGFTSDLLERSFDDLIRRQSLGEPCVEAILPLLKKHRLIHEHFEPSLRPKAVSAQVGERVVELEGNYEPWVPDHIDYFHNYR